MGKDIDTSDFSSYLGALTGVMGREGMYEKLVEDGFDPKAIDRLMEALLETSRELYKVYPM